MTNLRTAFLSSLALRSPASFPLMRRCRGCGDIRHVWNKNNKAPGRARRTISSTTAQWLSSTTTTVSDFQPPSKPPGTHGTPVFEDIDFRVLSSSEKQQGGSSLSLLESVQRNADPQAVFVVTGASRGIGLQFVKTFMHRTQGTIVACCRSPSTAVQLNDFLKTLSDPSRLVTLTLDLESQESIEAAGTYLRENFDRVDMLMNVAGLLGDGGKTTPGPERSITKMDRSWLEKTMAVNVIGPVMLTKEVAPLLVQKRSRRSTTDDEKSTRPVAVVVNMSARVGSISDNGLGGWMSYRMSKSALNQATRTMALELKRNSAWAVALHPGTTDTDLSQPFQANVKEGNLFPVEFTASRLLDVVDSMEEKHSGGFYDWAGQSLSF